MRARRNEGRLLMVLGLALCWLPAGAGAQEIDVPDEDPAAFQLTLVPQVQTSDRNRSVHGLRFNVLYGENENVYGIDLGLAGRARGDLRGGQILFVGLVDGDVNGVQANMFFNFAGGTVDGAQLGLVSYANTVNGFQWSVVNYAEQFGGAQLAFVNVAREARGAALGFVNYASQADGFQLGILNISEELDGVQVGLINVALNATIPVLPIVNIARSQNRAEAAASR